MLMIELQHKLLANQSMLCRRTLLRITQTIQISTTRDRLSHAILIRKVNASEETTVATLTTFHFKMIMNNDHDHVTTSLSQLREMIVNRLLITKMSLVGLMPSVLLRVDPQTTTRMAFRKQIGRASCRERVSSPV